MSRMRSEICLFHREWDWVTGTESYLFQKFLKRIHHLQLLTGTLTYFIFQFLSAHPFFVLRSLCVCLCARVRKRKSCPVFYVH